MLTLDLKEVLEIYRMNRLLELFERSKRIPSPGLQRSSSPAPSSIYPCKSPCNTAQRCNNNTTQRQLHNKLIMMTRQFAVCCLGVQLLCCTSFCFLPYTLFFIRNRFIRNQGSEGQNFKKLEGSICGNLRNFTK